MVIDPGISTRSTAGLSARQALMRPSPYRASQPGAPRSSDVCFMRSTTSDEGTPVAMRSAARPAACGDAIDVPAFQLYALFVSGVVGEVRVCTGTGASTRLLPSGSDAPSPPGALRSISAPALE